MEISTKTSFMNTSAEHFHSQWWTSNRETACREQRSRVIPRPAEKRDHQDCRTQACHCRPTLLCTYHTSSPHHMNRSHHPPLPLQQKMLWGHAPLLCARHSAWTGREQNHSRRGQLKSSLWWKDVHHERKHMTFVRSHFSDVQINKPLKGWNILGNSSRSDSRKVHHHQLIWLSSSNRVLVLTDDNTLEL